MPRRRICCWRMGGGPGFYRIRSWGDYFDVELCCLGSRLFDRHDALAGGFSGLNRPLPITDFNRSGTEALHVVVMVFLCGG